VVVVLADAPPEPAVTGDRRRRPALAAAVAVLVAVGLGWLGWVLPVPGGSLVVPTAVVAAVGTALAGVCWLGTRSRLLAASVVGVTAVAAVWTFAFSLPAALAWDPGATTQARAALAQLAGGPRDRYGVPLHPCATVSAGQVGPMAAPYRHCAVSTPEGHFVLFTTVGRPRQGLGYTDVGPATFPDECSRHLTGAWWMFTAPHGGTGWCPVGYRFDGGG
jgi:hypothetical protein